MGGSSSKEGSLRQSSSHNSIPYSWDTNHGYPQTSYEQKSHNYAPEYSYASPQYYPSSQQDPQYYPPPQSETQYHPPPQEHGRNQRILQRRYSKIADNFNSLDQVVAIKKLGRNGVQPIGNIAERFHV